jgi:hypothetical protein
MNTTSPATPRAKALPPASTPLPPAATSKKKSGHSIGLLVGVAVAFLVVGAGLAAVVMKLLLK